MTSATQYAHPPPGPSGPSPLLWPCPAQSLEDLGRGRRRGGALLNYDETEDGMAEILSDADESSPGQRAPPPPAACYQPGDCMLSGNTHVRLPACRLHWSCQLTPCFCCALFSLAVPLQRSPGGAMASGSSRLHLKTQNTTPCAPQACCSIWAATVRCLAGSRQRAVPPGQWCCWLAGMQRAALQPLWSSALLRNAPCLLLLLQGAARTRSPTPPICATAATVTVTATILTQRLREGQQHLCHHWSHHHRRSSSSGQLHLPRSSPLHPRQQPPSPSHRWRPSSSALRRHLQPRSRASRCLQLRPRRASRQPRHQRSAGSRPMARRQRPIE